MAGARAPGSTRTKRFEETRALKKHWELGRIQPKCRKQADPAFNDGYRYLVTIYSALALEHELFAEAINALQVLQLDKQDWRRRLDKHIRIGGGSAQDNFAFAMMREFIERQGIKNVKRAAELSIASMGLYPDAKNWVTAVTRCRGVWQRYKAGTFRPKGDVVATTGLFVRPRRDNLRRYEVRRILDPSDLKFLPRRGKRVSDTLYWRRLVELGFVEILQTN